jgi:hypothetical protein
LAAANSVSQCLKPAADLCRSSPCQGFVQSRHNELMQLFQLVIGLFAHGELLVVQVGDEPSNPVRVRGASWPKEIVQESDRRPW